MTGEVERLKAEEAQASLDKKRAAEALMQEVYRSNAEQVLTCSAQWPLQLPFSFYVSLHLLDLLHAVPRVKCFMFKAAQAVCKAAHSRKNNIAVMLN